MGMSGGSEQQTSPSSTTQTVISEPWAPQQPYLKEGFQKAEDLFLNSHPQIFPNSLTLPFSPETQTALQLTTQRALNGSPLTDSANNQVYNTMNGAYLNNPTVNGSYLYGGDAFNAALNAATNQILPQVNSAFEGSGRFNSGLAKEAQTKAIADSLAGLYGNERQLQEQNFNNQRQQQLQATMLAPDLANQDYANYGQLANVGQAYQDQLQNQLNEQIYRYGYGNNMDRNDLMTFMGLVNGNYGQSTTGTTTSTGGTVSQSNPRNPIMGGLGGALIGNSLYPAAAGSTFGLGSIAGGLLGAASSFF